MRTFLKRLVIPLLLIVIGFAGGSVFGFFNGLGAFALIDATPRGALAVANLNALAAGKPESVKVLLEHEVDQSLTFFFGVRSLVVSLVPAWFVLNRSQ